MSRPAVSYRDNRDFGLLVEELHRLVGDVVVARWGEGLFGKIAVRDMRGPDSQTGDAAEDCRNYPIEFLLLDETRPVREPFSRIWPPEATGWWNDDGTALSPLAEEKIGDWAETHALFWRTDNDRNR